MPNSTHVNLPPEVYHAIIEVQQQRNDIKEIISEVKEFRIESHGRITKLETKAGLLGFMGGLIGGSIVTAIVKFVMEMAM